MTLLSIKEVCRRLGGPDKPLHPASIFRMVARGELNPPVRIGPRLARWPADEIDDYLARRADPRKRRLLPTHPQTKLKARERKRQAEARNAMPPTTGKSP